MLGRMPAPVEYLDFAERWFPAARVDLATSGIRAVSAADLAEIAGETPAPDDHAQHDRFAAVVAARYGVRPTGVAPALGTSGALWMAMLIALERDAEGHVPSGERRVLVESPGYEPFSKLAGHFGAGVDRFERDPVFGTLPPAEQVERKLTPTTRIVVISNPHNPTGTYAPVDALKELAARLAMRRVWLLVDEAYGELHAPGVSARSAGNNVLAVASTTKCLGVPWPRAGWILLPGWLRNAAHTAGQLAYGAPPPASSAWGALAMQHADALLERARELQGDKRAVVDAALARWDFAEWSQPAAASPYGWVRDRTGRDLDTLLERARETEGLIVSPGRFFGDSAGLRFSWTADAETVEAGLGQLEDLLRP